MLKELISPVSYTPGLSKGAVVSTFPGSIVSLWLGGPMPSANA